MTLETGSRLPICNPVLDPIDNYNQVQFGSLGSNISQVMIQKANELKLICDLVKYIEVTHMQTHPSPNRGL